MDERDELERALNERQKRFALEYVRNGGNGTEAAISAGYSARSAHVQASRLLKDDKVLAYRRMCARDLYKALALTPDAIGMEIWGIYRRCMQGEEHLSWDSEQHAYVPDGSWVFDAKNALKALEMLAKLDGTLVERVEVTAPEQPITLARMLELARGVVEDAGGGAGPEASDGAAEKLQ